MNVGIRRVVKKRGGLNNLLSLGLLLLSTALILASIFLLTKSRNASSSQNSAAAVQESTQPDNKGTDTYTSEDLGYSINYPSLLEPRSVSSDDYISLIIFFVPNTLRGDGFAISVTDRSLEEEKNLIKDKIGKETKVKITEETRIRKDNFDGFKLIIDPEVEGTFESKAFIVLNNGKYSYSLSSIPDFIDEVLNNFTILK